MNKKVLEIVVVLSIIAMVIIGIFFYTKNASNKEAGYTIISDGYSSYESKILSSYKEYTEFVDYIDFENKAYGKVYDFDSNKYKEEYFNNKSLAIINIITGSGMNKLNKIDISIIGNLLLCKPDIEYAKGTVTDDINGKLLLIEIDKSVTKLKIEK